ncbi:UNVERIFIED_CONTAM: putative aarF domain-containing protein kinase 1 [Gekko kuhli]
MEHSRVAAAMARRALKLASFATVAATTTGLYLYSNKPLDPNDFGFVRVGRAVATTAVITYDYLTSLRSIPRGTEEYDYVKSQTTCGAKFPVMNKMSEDHPQK